MWDAIKQGFRSFTEWLASTIKLLWNTFLVFLHVIISFTRVVIKAVKKMVARCVEAIYNFKEKVKAKIIRFFAIITHRGDTFGPIIGGAINAGKVGSAEIDLTDNAEELPEQVHIVQVDENLNTKQVYTVAGYNFDEEFRNRCSQEVTELNLNL